MEIQSQNKPRNMHKNLYLNTYLCIHTEKLDKERPSRTARGFNLNRLYTGLGHTHTYQPCATWHFTSDTSDHQICGGFSHTTKHFLETSRMSKNSTQFWHYLPGDSIRFHKLKSRFHRKILANYASDKVLMSKILKEIIQFYRKRK